MALQTSFFETLPKLKEAPQSKADIAWMLYDLKLDKQSNRFKLTQNKIVYTEFEPALEQGFGNSYLDYTPQDPAEKSLHRRLRSWR